MMSVGPPLRAPAQGPRCYALLPRSRGQTREKAWPEPVLHRFVPRVMPPLAHVVLRHGVTYPRLASALKRVFLAAAQAELAQQHAKPTDRAITLRSSVHRRDARNLLRAEPQSAAQRRPLSLATQVVAQWLNHRSIRTRGDARATVARMAIAAVAGYSGTPLPKKLGIAPGMRVAALNPPGDYRELVAPWPAGATVVARADTKCGLVHLFAVERAVLAKEAQRLRRLLMPDAALWISWPKKAARVPTDITEDVIREVVLPMGWVDVKVCAVDATWSGLKLVVRRELRTLPG